MAAHAASRYHLWRTIVNLLDITPPVRATPKKPKPKPKPQITESKIPKSDQELNF